MLHVYTFSGTNKPKKVKILFFQKLDNVNKPWIFQMSLALVFEMQKNLFENGIYHFIRTFSANPTYIF